jgi:predicted anti-sigma-YlaC factor YlaD
MSWLRWQAAAAPFDRVDHVCGLCGADWTPAAGLLIIGALVAVISLVARSGVAPTRFRGGDDE